MTVALIGALGAVLAAVAGGLMTYVLSRKRASDKDVLWLWRTAFDRPAFKGQYMWRSDQRGYRDAIRRTIKCVNTGILEAQDQIVGKAKPKSQLRDPRLRVLGDSIERKLSRVAQLIPEPPPSGPVPALADEMDNLRTQIIESLNDAWKRAGIPPMNLPLDLVDD